MLATGIALVFNKVIKFSWKIIGLSFCIFICILIFAGIGNEIIYQLGYRKIINIMNISHRDAKDSMFTKAILKLTKNKVFIPCYGIYLVYPIWTF